MSTLSRDEGCVSLETETTTVVASAPTPTPAPPTTNAGLSFSDLLAGMKAIEDLIDRADEDFDPEKMIGSLSIKDATEEQKAALRAKVDAMEYVVREFDAYAERTEARAKRTLARSESAARKAERLRNYVLYQMQAQKFDVVAGNDMIVKLKTHHTPRAIPTRPATPSDYATHPTLVRLIPREYQWDGKALVSLWKNHGKPNDGSDIMLPSVDRDGVEIAMPIDFVKYEFSQKVIFDERDRPDVNEKKKKAKKK